MKFKREMKHPITHEIKTLNYSVQDYEDYEGYGNTPLQKIINDFQALFWQDENPHVQEFEYHDFLGFFLLKPVKEEKAYKVSNYGLQSTFENVPFEVMTSTAFVCSLSWAGFYAQAIKLEITNEQAEKLNNAFFQAKEFASLLPMEKAKLFYQIID